MAASSHPAPHVRSPAAVRPWFVPGLAIGGLAAVMAMVALPRRSYPLCGRVDGGQAAVEATLKNLARAQAQWQASASLDRDGDGVGEFGFAGDLAGGAMARDGRPSTPPCLPAWFGALRAGRVERGGYLFQVFLPDGRGVGVAEGDGPRHVDPEAAEASWCCYAWPVERGSSGHRSYFVNQAGDVLATVGELVGYDGDRLPCPSWAAFRSPNAHGLAGSPAANTVGCDGNRWVLVY